MLKKVLLLLALILQLSLNVYSQGFFSTGSYTNTDHGSGATNIVGWGENFDRTIDIRPNPHPTYGTMMVNYHFGLTISAHSYYGGIRFYNQGYPSAYDSASGSEMVMSISNGSVGIATTDTKGYKFAVNGSMIATAVTVKTYTNWPDYVFKKKYSLMPLSKLNTFISENEHLPEVPSAKEISENGVNLGEMNKLLLKKVEELTLYLIEKDREIHEMKQSQQKQIASITKRIKRLERP